MSQPYLSLLSQTFTIHRLGPQTGIPPDLLILPFIAITRTDEELSVVAPEEIHIQSQRCEAGWACFKVEGPLDFGLTGILAGISKTLAESEISIFAISTFDTDYILVKRDQVQSAVKALKSAGYALKS